MYQCHICGSTYKLKAELVRHLAIHEGLSFKCDHCDKVFATKYYLSAHMKNYDVKKLHVCEHKIIL